MVSVIEMFEEAVTLNSTFALLGAEVDKRMAGEVNANLAGSRGSL
jgi:hypothetical protein